MLRTMNKEEVASLESKMIKIDLDMDEFYEKTIHKLLSMFSHSLTMEEASDISFSYEDLHLKNEKKFLLLLEDLYAQSPAGSIIIEMPYSEIDEQEHLNILEQVDRYEQYQWIGLIKRTEEKPLTHFFKIDEFQDLKLIYQINAREILFCNIHFLELGISIRGHFDMSMEVFFKNSEAVEIFASKVEAYQLFLRTYLDEIE